MSDVSYIPSATIATLDRALDAMPAKSTDFKELDKFAKPGGFPSNLNGRSSQSCADQSHQNLLPFSSNGIEAWESPARVRGRIPYLILDCLSLQSHPSHVTFLQALSVAMLLDPLHTFLVGFAHTVSHNEWEAACREVEGTRESGTEEEMINNVSASAAAQGSMMKEVWNLAREEWRGFIRPAYDGQIFVTK